MDNDITPMHKDPKHWAWKEIDKVYGILGNMFDCLANETEGEDDPLSEAIRTQARVAFTCVSNLMNINWLIEKDNLREEIE